MAFERHENEQAMHLFPRSHGMERRILARLMKTHKPAAAVRAVDEKIRRLWISSLQSRMFNDVLARQPSFASRLTSSSLRGVPSGFEGSNTISPV